MDFQSTGTVPERVEPVRNSQERGPVCRRERDAISVLCEMRFGPPKRTRPYFPL